MGLGFGELGLGVGLGLQWSFLQACHKLHSLSDAGSKINLTQPISTTAVASISSITTLRSLGGEADLMMCKLMEDKCVYWCWI